jgi:hypothetical protein
VAGLSRWGPCKPPPAHSPPKNIRDTTPAIDATVRSVTRSNTSHTTPEVVNASDSRPASAARFAAVTNHGRSPCRNRIRWKATGAMIRPVATTDPLRINR